MDSIPKIDNPISQTSAPNSTPATPAKTSGDVSVFSCGEDTSHLISNSDAKQKAQIKLTRAISLIKQYSSDYAKGGYGPDFGKELEELGEENIRLESANADNARSMADSRYVTKPEKRPYSDSMGPKALSSRINLHYNNKSVYEASDEEIAATIVHELGHIRDKDNIDSIAEEKDVETQAVNFKEFISGNKNFKYSNTPEGLDNFLKVYKENPCKKYDDFSPGHDK